MMLSMGFTTAAGWFHFWKEGIILQENYTTENITYWFNC